MAKVRTCFVISPIGPDDSDVRKRADDLIDFILEPVLTPMNFEVIRADRMSSPGSITAQVIAKVMNSELVIADLTGHNPNVFYELAIRHAVQKPYIQLTDPSSPPPFDIKDERTITFDISNLRSVEKCKKQLQRQVEAVMANSFTVSTPIGKAIELRSAIREGGASAVILDRLESIEKSIASLCHWREIRDDQVDLWRHIVENELYAGAESADKSNHTLNASADDIARVLGSSRSRRDPLSRIGTGARTIAGPKRGLP